MVSLKILQQANEDLGGFGPNTFSFVQMCVGTIHQVRRMKWIIVRLNARVVGLKYMFHIGYESTYLFNLVGPEVYSLPMVIYGVDLLGWISFKFFWIPTELIQ